MAKFYVVTKTLTTGVTIEEEDGRHTPILGHVWFASTWRALVLGRDCFPFDADGQRDATCRVHKLLDQELVATYKKLKRLEAMHPSSVVDDVHDAGL